jgi:hypothetical protein
VRSGVARRWLGAVGALGIPSVLLAVVLAGCGNSAPHAPVQTVASPKAAVGGSGPSSIAVIVMENEEYGAIVGSPSAPFVNGLARRYALARSAYAITHPSLPNYLALTGGSTFGIDSDCTDCRARGTGLAGQLTRAGISWKAYMEDLPHPCYTAAGAGQYAKKHDPFIYYPGLGAGCERVVALGELATDESGGTLPRFVWITPNLCHDGHDCSIATGDRFLSGLVPPLLRALGPRGLLVITWDEGTSGSGCCRLASGGHVATILAGGAARRGARLATPVDHYSTLQTIEDLFGVARLGGAACVCTPTLAPLLRRVAHRSA